ncbi:MAG: bifunctional adenosylcobinamide kinase/adenosylcobinamide-phosphate guanylyltransferase [Planctomycetota bacterium]
MPDTRNLVDSARQAGNGSLTLVLGGVRSGKSRFAQELAYSVGGDDVLFVATAEAGDGEMSDRIRRHQESRPAAWNTLECPLKVGETLANLESAPNVILLDCLTLLVSNVMFREDAKLTRCEHGVQQEVDALVQAAEHSSSHIVVVSGEVGCGIVPESRMGREFRDLLGFANQRLAAASVATYYMVAGLAIEARRLASSASQASRAYSLPVGDQA